MESWDVVKASKLTEKEKMEKEEVAQLIAAAIQEEKRKWEAERKQLQQEVLSLRASSTTVNANETRTPGFQTTSTPATPVVVVQNERRITPFSGQQRGSQDDLVDDWISIVKQTIAHRRLNSSDAVDFVKANLTGLAKEDVMARPEDQRNTADLIFDILRQGYGDNDTAATLRHRLYARKQESSENFTEFSIHLARLAEKVRVKEGTSSNQEELKQLLASGTRNPEARREARRLIESEPNLDYWKLRDRVKKVIDDDNRIDIDLEEAAVPGPSWEKCFKELSDKFDKLSSTISKSKEGRPGTSKRNSSGCHRCGSSSHFIKECPKKNEDKRNTFAKGKPNRHQRESRDSSSPSRKSKNEKSKSSNW